MVNTPPQYHMHIANLSDWQMKEAVPLFKGNFHPECNNTVKEAAVGNVAYLL